MIKNQIISGKCLDYTFDGLGVVKYDTFCLFVKGMLVNEEGEIIVTSVKKNYGYGRLLKLTVPSSERREFPCQNAKQCGGCQLQHMSYQEQLSFKHDIVQKDINNIAHLETEVLSVLAAENPYAYRNKIIMPVKKDKSGNTATGFYRYNSHDIIPIEQCLLQSDVSNQLVNKIKILIDKYDLSSLIRYVMLRDMVRTEQIMVVFICYKKDIKSLKPLCDELVKYESKIKSIILNVNGEDTNVVLGKEDYLLYGNDHIFDILCGLKFKVSAHSFYQVNTFQTEKLYMQAIKMAELSKNDIVLDLYCGVGTIGLSLSRYVKKVIGVEIVEQAIIDAKENARINQIDNAEFICGDAQKVVRKFQEENIHFDCIVVDPPRKGCSNDTIDSLINLQSKKIVYISCHPSTLARDLNKLKEHYEIKMIQPVDMFSQTYHVETVVLLSHKKLLANNLT